MKIIIINSPLFRDRNDLYDEDSLPPLGLGYIATNLKNNGIEVHLIDAVFERIPLKNLIARLNRAKPDFVAVNVFTTNKDLVREMIEKLKFKTHFIVGGLSTKQLYKEIIYWKTANPIDIVTGDGELITLDIVNGIVSEAPFLQHGNRRVFQVNNNSIYLPKDISDIALDRSFFLNEPVQHALGFIEANIVASRGCVYNCAFCAAARSLNKETSPRERSEDSVIRELHGIQDSFPKVNSIRVLDDLFLKYKMSIEKAIRIFSKFSFQWRSMAHVMTFNQADDQLMTDLKSSGCHELFIGIESGSPKILSAIEKTSNVDTILKNLTKVFKAGINMKGYFIYGFPNETLEDMEMTFSLAKKLKELSIEYGVNFRTSVFQYRPYHGTQIYHELETQGVNMKVHHIEPNQDLSDLVGRLQFNFHSGNYSDVDNQTLNSYIYRTTNLNGGKIFADLKANTKSLQ